ncbi:hypothetical protein HYDPIDRAFT_98329 [Hydnomerulius pinastri MD-312]|uniref:DUF974-domain-containing protein n=1 Tax=Hydnomerulius pinastri MD-312 TaxID=994086 RepID=A0A0C9WAM9_9AGAM|nr:hypothetical protein HYDPIDRAFT_98329 [Hydnomerulius pinastri MD-312]
MANVDGQGHLLSLKVMRVSRPGLASAWEPFYSSSPSFSAHSTASILSLQGKTPLPGHPKTLRDLTHVSEFLTLPAAFGAIQLGETFSSCLCVNNEANVDVEGVSIRVEMQTANSKSILAELGGPEYRLAVADGFEHVVHHEVKELGQHVLACVVTYRLPPGFRHAPGPAEGSSDPSLQSFRKYYKFAVTNPLSVKTKVHTPKSPSALLHSLEREKVFLEVHIQNMTQEPMWFDRMEFECVEGWSAVDANRVSKTDDSGTKTQLQLFSGSMALMQPQAVRQYIYILSPATIPSFPVPLQPGVVIPLGRLDISWRSQFGEPGRLLTSTLSRRITGPAPPPPPQPQPQLPATQQPPTAIPPYLQRNTPAPSSPSRPRSPQLPPSRPNSPPPNQFRPGSPFRKPQALPPIQRPHSPAGSISSISVPPTQPLVVPDLAPDLDVDLVVVRRVDGPVFVEKPFTLGLRITVAASIPRGRRQGVVSLVVQHLQPSRASSGSAPETSQVTATSSTRFSSYASPSTQVTPAQTPYIIAGELPLVSSPQKLVSAEGDITISLPPPYFDTPDETRNAKLKGCSFLGPSAISLAPMKLTPPPENENDDIPIPRAEGSQEFELTFQPLRTGFVCVGGLRVILVGDDISDVDGATHRAAGKGPRTLKELDILAEVWVRS